VFLVLDDVWKDKVFDSLDLAKGDGSVTLLTTRNLSLLERESPHISQEHMTEDFKIFLEDILWHWIGEGIVPRIGGHDSRGDAFSL
jgi:agmatine/peptidylarginine deiminase